MGSITKNTKKRLRINKNRKKAWGKYCSVDDIDEYFEEKRFEERIGGSVTEKQNEDLFFVHSTSVETAAKDGTKKPLKCFQNIGAYTKVPPASGFNAKCYTKKILKRMAAEDKKRTRKVSSKREASKKFSVGEFYDLWADKAGETRNKDILSLIKFRDEYMKKRPIKVPEHLYQKPSLLPAVEVPHAGASYNPAEKDHQALLLKALEVEEKKIEEELRFKKKYDDKFPTKAEAPTQKSILEEMSQGLFDDKEETDEDVSGPFLSSNPPITAENRKKRSVRNKQWRHRLRESKAVARKNFRRRQNEIHRIKAIEAEIEEAENKSKVKQFKKDLRKIKRMYKPSILSKYKYVPPDLEIKLTEELNSSLRTLKAEGNALEDRYKSLQRRNILEARIHQTKRRKYPLKIKEKRQYKEIQ